MLNVVVTVFVPECDVRQESGGFLLSPLSFSIAKRVMEEVRGAGIGDIGALTGAFVAVVAGTVEMKKPLPESGSGEWLLLCCLRRRATGVPRVVFS
ncbi:hypothetical protein WH50_15970 [Pokkaliibacter plantistimulans]|uniref:Uncharacterized protein n=1 Tax=Pokkaliibacter plantistimulans TaxID=1635171 RepID=A0ABX5LYD0_9GAMM|nr:hypothetical protein WH50_15970 [Pokkaliibacter plantistimulans]